MGGNAHIHIENNAWAYGQGYDEQADAYLRPPDWSDMTDWYAAATEDYAIRNGVADYDVNTTSANSEGDGS